MPRPLSREQLLTIFELWEEGASRQQVADALGVSINVIDEHRYSGQLKGQLTPRRGAGSKSGGIPDNPTPEQIAEVEARKLAVQSRWTPEQRAQRLQGVAHSQFRVSEIVAAYKHLRSGYRE